MEENILNKLDISFDSSIDISLECSQERKKNNLDISFDSSVEISLEKSKQETK